MSKNFVQSAFAKDASIGLYRLYARSQFWRTGPRIFVNSLPKAGTHLLMSMLDLVPGIMNSRLHIPTRSIGNRIPEGFEFDKTKLQRQLRTIRKGQVVSAHLPFAPNLDKAIIETGFHMVNLVRSPRDMLISRYFYVAGLRRHRLHNYLTEHYPDKKAMLIALIEGPKPGEDTLDGRFRPYADLFRVYGAWTSMRGVLTVRYEDLVGSRGGGDDERQLVALSSLSRHLRLPISGERLQSEWKAVEHRGTSTLRKGTIGDWVNHFDPDIEEVFERHMGSVARIYEVAR